VCHPFIGSGRRGGDRARQVAGDSGDSIPFRRVKGGGELTG
jgi:hypothetical protein